jgi:hypothetical protein
MTPEAGDEPATVSERANGEVKLGATEVRLNSGRLLFYGAYVLTLCFPRPLPWKLAHGTGRSLPESSDN